jgi:hypothetical protein
MAFLFQDQNQGIRNDAPHGVRLSRPFSFIRTMTVGFGITPNLLTLPLARKALAGLGLFTLTAGGDFHPALRTLATRYEQPEQLCPRVAARASGKAMAYPHAPMTSQRSAAAAAAIVRRSRKSSRTMTGGPAFQEKFRGRGERSTRAASEIGRPDSREW